MGEEASAPQGPVLQGFQGAARDVARFQTTHLQRNLRTESDRPGHHVRMGVLIGVRRQPRTTFPGSPSQLCFRSPRRHSARMRAIVRQRWENQIKTETASRKSWMRSMSEASSGANSNAGGI
jgi:hypothetical protein